MAMRTERLRIGTLVTALARRQPWELARETVTLDHLSHGRLILSVGLGIPYDGAFAKVGRPTDRRTRAQQLDEGLDILTGLWSGQPFRYQGAHYQVDEMTFLPPPVQRPRIPIWVVGAWPRKPSMQRVLRCDGVIATEMNEDGSFAQPTPEDIRDMKTFIDEQRSLMTPFDIVVEGETSGDDRVQAGTVVQPFAAAGATWWVEGVPASAWEQGDWRACRPTSSRVHRACTNPAAELHIDHVMAILALGVLQPIGQCCIPRSLLCLPVLPPRCIAAEDGICVVRCCQKPLAAVQFKCLFDNFLHRHTCISRQIMQHISRFRGHPDRSRRHMLLLVA
jgi:hypothetical protein